MLAFTTATALLLASGTEGFIRVEGTSGCPTAAEVTAKLDRLLPLRPPGVEADLASIDVDSGVVRLILARPDGTVVGEKRFEPKASCADMAQALAVVLAIWERPLRPGLMPPLDPSIVAEARGPEQGSSPSEPTPPASTVATESAVANVPRATAGSDAANAERRSRLASVDRSMPEASPDRKEPGSSPPSGNALWRFEGGAGVQATLPSAAPGALVEGTLRRTAAGWGPRIALGGAWWNEEGLAVGQVAWTRLTGAIGLIHGWSSPRLFLDVREQFVAGILVARGRGFDETHTRAAFDPGIEAGVRAGASVGPFFRVWLDVGLSYWPIPQELRVEGIDQVIEAAPWSGALSIGGTFLSVR
jgi:hypothetical protein